jgi:hypothetical protein
LRILLLAPLALLLAGCCGIAQALCGIEPPADPPAYTRKSPEDTIYYLADCFRNRRIRAAYETLHPDWLQQMRDQGAGQVTLGDFTTLYTHFEDDFQADAELLTHGELSLPVYSDDRRRSKITVTADNGALLTLVLENRPSYRIHLDDGDELEGSIPSVAGSVQVDGADLIVSRRLPLLDLAGIPETSITRVDLTDEWLVRGIVEAEGIRFITRLEEQMGEASQ